MRIADIRQGDLVERKGVWKTVVDVSNTEITALGYMPTESPNGAPVFMPFCFPINEVTGHIRAAGMPNAVKVLEAIASGKIHVELEDAVFEQGHKTEFTKDDPIFGSAAIVIAEKALRLISPDSIYKKGEN